MFDKIMKILKVHFQTQLTLKDGTQLEVSGNYETGAQVQVVTSDGLIPLPDGEYQLADPENDIITVKDGLIMDIIKPGTVEEATAGLEPSTTDTTSNDLEAQNGNPEVSGVDEQPLTGTTTEVVSEPLPVEGVDVPGEAPEADGTAPEVEIEMPDPAMIKIAELETKIAGLETALKDIMDKLNLISEKFSAAQPIIKKKNDDEGNLINPKLANKVALIKSLKKS